MRTLSRPTVLLILLALVVSACGTAGNPANAAEVNGESISVSTVESRFDTVAANPQFADQLRNDPDGTLTAQVQAQLLTELIHARLWEQGASDLGIEITDEDVAERREQLIDEVGGQDAFDDLVEQSGLTEADLQREVRNIVVRERVEDELTADLTVADEDVEAFYEEHREERYDLVEARHILVETEAEAEEALGRIEDGEDFADVARDVSIDGSADAGGDLGEFGRGQMVPEFEQAAFDADVGEVTGPVQSQFGFHIIEVTGRTEQDLSDVDEEIRSELRRDREGAAVQDWFVGHLQEADISVNPRFGEWDQSTGEVVPTDVLGEPGPGAPAEPELPADDVELDVGD